MLTKESFLHFPCPCESVLHHQWSKNWQSGIQEQRQAHWLQPLKSEQDPFYYIASKMLQKLDI